MASLKSIMFKKDVIDPKRKREAQLWVETVLGVKINYDLFNELKDGTILCEVLNKIQPGTCSKYKKSKIAFVCRNNIEIFIKGARKLGIPATDMFETRDLYDKQRLSAVLQTLYAVSAMSRKLCFPGPFIGVSYSDPHKRHFTKAQLAKAKITVPLLNRGNKAKFSASKHDLYSVNKTIKSMHKPSEGSKKQYIPSQHQSYGLINTQIHHRLDFGNHFHQTTVNSMSSVNQKKSEEGFQKKLSNDANINEGNEETKHSGDYKEAIQSNDRRLKNDENEGDSCEEHECHCDILWYSTRVKQLEAENRILKSYIDKHISQAYADVSISEENKNAHSINATPNVKITRQLTKKGIPNKVDEELSNTFEYINQFIHIYHENAIEDHKCDGKDVKVIDCGIHCKKTQEPLYIVCTKKNQLNKNSTLWNWKTVDDLYSVSELKQTYNISKQSLSLVTIDEQIIAEMKIAKQQITNILENKILRDNIIDNKNTPWNNEDKIPIFNKTSNQNGLTLQLEKHQFVDKLTTFADQNVADIKLVPIVRFNSENKYFYEIAWIVEIEQDINIAISFKCTNDHKYLPSAIYLDIYDQHKLVAYKHDCQCLTSFNCIIDRLQIGENKTTRIHQRYKSEMDKRMTKYENQIDDIKSKYSNLQRDLQSLVQKQNEVNQQQNTCHQLHVLNALNTLMLTPQPISPQPISSESFQNYNNQL